MKTPLPATRLTETVRTVVIAIFFLAIHQNVFAQERWFEVTAGPSVSIPQAKGAEFKYSPRILPSAGISGFFSINKTFAIKTGLLYQVKGLSTEAAYVPDSIYDYQRFQSRSTYHMLNIPLQLAVSIPASHNDVYRIAVGMSYGFMLAGNTKIGIQSYNADQEVDRETRSYMHIIALQPKDNVPGLPKNEGTPLKLFTPALRLDFTYQWQERLLLSAFYEYNMEDVRLRTPDKSKINLHYMGVSFGVLFW